MSQKRTHYILGFWPVAVPGVQRGLSGLCCMEEMQGVCYPQAETQQSLWERNFSELS